MRIPVVMAVLLFAISILVDLYIFFDIRRNSGGRKGFPLTYAALSAACWIFLAVCIFRPRRDLDTGITFQMWGLYAYLTVYFPKIIFSLFSILGGFPHLWRRKPLRLGLWLGLPLAIMVFAAMWWGTAVTRNRIEVKKVEITSPKIPAGFDGYRIMQISDLHVGTRGDDTGFISEFVDSMNAQKPDVIFFTGDIVNRETGELSPFLNILSRLEAPAGVYSILGNHDYGDYLDWDQPEEKVENLQLLKNWQRQIGWKLLNNESAFLVSKEDTIPLIGVENWGEPPFHQYGHLLDAFPIEKTKTRHLNDSTFKILLTHNPEHWRREVTQISNIDLTLSGHTHAMQTVFSLGGIRWSPSAWRYEQWGGLYEKENPRGEKMKIYVNTGAGEVGMPYRIGVPPEITLITLRSTSKKK